MVPLDRGSYALTMVVTAFFCTFIGPPRHHRGGFPRELDFFPAHALRDPAFLSWVLDPEGFYKSDRIRQNQNLLMQTSVPAPPFSNNGENEGRVTPNQLFKLYKAKFIGYQVSVQGIFTAPRPGRALQ